MKRLACLCALLLFGAGCATPPPPAAGEKRPGPCGTCLTGLGAVGLLWLVCWQDISKASKTNQTEKVSP